MEHISDLQALLQVGSMGPLAIVAYFLWKLSNQILELKTSIDTLIETLIRFVPGIDQRKDK